MYSDNLVIKLNTIAHRFREYINQALNEILSQAKYRNTGASLASLHVEVIDGDNNKAPQIIITFADSLNILDKRKLQWTKLPNIDNMDDWAQTKTFDTIPGYKNGAAPNLPPWKQKERVAWAIAYNKKKFDTWKAKPWRKKSLSNVLKEMNAQILLAFDKAIEEDFQAGIDKAIATA